MQPSFKVSVDKSHDLISFELFGNIDEVEASDFAKAREAAFLELDRRSGEYVTLIDVTRCSILPQKLIPMFERMLNEPERHARRAAIVIDTVLATIQARRLLRNRPDVRIFNVRGVAERWLFLHPD